MMVLKKLKGNLFPVAVILVYTIIALINPSMGIESVKNSGYYIKEMVSIMPVIFILTALLDIWVPKEKIMQFLGKDAKGKGIFLAFIIGSISAGPVYAAFPMCVMLHKKGASIRNIIIILSSWAVIKVPMLLNEAKFLGPKFMIIRWVLTVTAIIVFSWIADSIIKDEDLSEKDNISKTGVIINKGACMGCTLCVGNYPELFEMNGKKAVIKIYDETNMDKERLQVTIKACPVRAIEYSVDI